MTKKHVHHSKHEEVKSSSFLDKAKEYYFKEYMKLFYGLIILFLLCAGFLFFNYMKTGEFTKRDVSLKGGISLVITTDYKDVKGLEESIRAMYPEASLNFRTVEDKGNVVGIIIEATDISEEELLGAVKEKIVLTRENYNIESMGSSLGESFFKQMFVALLFAMLFMGIVFHIYFRNVYATFAAIFSAFMNILITFAIMVAMDVRLTAGGIAAYLMLIGYSVDTSILLSTKVLKDKGELKSKLFGAMKTGLTMSVAGIFATGVSYLVTNNITLKQIMLILIVGLVIDILTTWIGNAAFLRMKLEKEDVQN